jgi:catechol 2,3-dioxygenase-like lactoylglutathione lyase family enzyme
MGLNGLLDIELSVPNPQELNDFWLRRGLVQTADGVLGTVDRAVQLRIAEGTYRHMSELHLSCETEQDLADIAGRIGAMGVASTISGTRLTCIDPVFAHRVGIDVGAQHPLSPAQQRAWNYAGDTQRTNDRAPAVVENSLRVPRRLGHVVLATPHLDDVNAFMFEGLGVRISDQILGGAATMGRVEQDHHNLFIQPGATSSINHYAFEMDDLDAIGKAGQAVIDEYPEANVVGIGRHFIGSNVFWYLLDPAGNMFEFFTDMDQIIDGERWDREVGRRDWGSPENPLQFAVWGPKEPETFFFPADTDVIAAAREALGLR